MTDIKQPPMIELEIPKTPTPIEQTPSPSDPTTGLAGEPVPDSLVDIDYFMKVELRVALVESAEVVPKSKKLLKLQVDVGPLGKRQILSGISQFYTPESLIGRKVIIVANLKPAKLMGLDSHGMLLATSDDAMTTLIVADPGQDLEPGLRVR